MKKVFYIPMIFTMLMIMQGCGSIQLSAKEVQIELGSEAPEEIVDYVSVEDKYREEFERNAVLDLSGIDAHNVGEYQAIVAYEGKEAAIPVIVEDTTPPEIWLKDTCFREGDEVYDREMVYTIDMSDVDIYVSVDGKRYGESFIVYPEMMLEVEATDAYGNRAVKEMVPYVREAEEKGIAGGSRIISSVYAEEMCYADEEAYQALKKAYGQVEWENEFEAGDLKTYASYREKFRELVENEKPFYDKKTDNWIYLDEYRKKDVYYLYYFFDMDSDGVPELGIQNGRMLSFFKYDEDKDQFFLWNEWIDYKMNGSRVLRREEFSSGAYERYYFCRLDENGNEICTVWFRVWLYLDKEIEDKREVYVIAFPEYADQKNEIPEDIKKKGYNYYGTYIFRVTEEQYHELTEGYFAVEDTVEDREMDVTYRHEELWGSGIE